ncbi:MAG TPA: DUF3352 domain-containing protein [Thermoleophilaceae bacterium]|nr:DUF3352 domain-containing protein [Thermoleophilaceae bacterium]
MRKLSFLPVLVTTLAIAGCGGSGSSGDDGSSPLDNALRYLPADAPFAVAIDTDTEGEQAQNAEDLAEQFAFGDQLEEQLRGLAEDRAGKLEDIQAALGNEFVVGSTDARTFVDTPSGEDTAFVGAIQAKSQDALDKLIAGDKAKEDGEVDGAKLYKDDSGDSFAIDGDMLVVAGSKRELEDALATRDGDDAMTEEAFDAGTEGVSKDALLRVFVDVGGLLRASPDAKPALKSKWVSALRTAGIALTFQPEEVAIEVDMSTDPSDLTEADLPLAAGAAAPQPLDRDGDVNLALRDPAQVLEFAQATAKAIDPNGFSQFETGKQQIERRLGVDLDRDVIDQLDGDLAVSIGLDGKFGARAQLEDSAAFERTLVELEDVLPDVAEGVAGGSVGFAKPKAGEDFYAVATADGDQIVFGVVRDVFVISNDPKIAGTLADASARAVPGAAGALVLDANAERLAQLALEQAAGKGFGLGDRIVGAVGARPLDALLGSFEMTTQGLSGTVRVTTD